jgi:hypothetical protein
LDRIIGPGDLLAVESGEDSMNGIGELNGMFGHVLLISGAPTCLWEGEDSEGLEAIWPADVTHVWQAPTIECTRKQDGFMYNSIIMFYIEPSSGECKVLGEVSADNVVTPSTPPGERPEKLKVYCCPSALRASWQPHLMQKVLTDMESIALSWSWSTAIRAYLLGSRAVDHSTPLDDVMNSWEAKPICTSVVITFWQQYLCALAAQDSTRTAMEYITAYMPLKADCALPTNLFTALLSCGWVCMQRFPS